MTDAEKREAAHQFINRWMGRGNEDEDGRSYWLEFLSNVMGMENPTERVNFEKKVIVNGNTKRIDVYIPETHVIIEQKSLGKSLDQKIHNSGDVDLTPYEQAKRYNDNLPYDETDFSENMIKQAKRRGTTEKLSFCVADATALSYENENFDCVVISNALHIMPEPEKAMQEIRRVLKKDGILYAPTFLWAEKKSSGLRKRLMSITGFKAYKEWNKENFCEFITDYGFTVVKVNLVDGGLAPVGVLIAKKTNY